MHYSSWIKRQDLQPFPLGLSQTGNWSRSSRSRSSRSTTETCRQCYLTAERRTRRQRRCRTAADNQFPSQRPDTWELKNLTKTSTKKQLVQMPTSLQKKMSNNIKTF
ncbi:hypothetical protein pdam_00001626 [Pocillopora damicornis]|uniref:Uncharacterized protein n=1 Tax=Pocillopora damicornis TaxID=46731 RepID=A0A3M6U599_POCDA|nr:hypothetical protein pdam_00001626 [Pocillopora damicornis]